MLSLLIASLGAVPPELVEIAERMRMVESLSAELLQEKEVAVLADVQRAQGRFTFARPRRLAMDLGGPGGTRLLIDGDVMTLTHKALGKTETLRLSRDPRSRAMAEQLFALVAADPDTLTATYDIEITQKAPLGLRLVPKHPELLRVLAKVEVMFTDDKLVQEIVLHEASGDRTRWRFSRHSVNAGVAPELFVRP